ncbi:MAG: ESPR-type extended signal peptide-containing protein, partial [Megasphaera lornae]
MNKVYQVIWSRVRHCYMAVAETVARSHYKHSSKSAAKATWAAVAAAGLLTGIPAFSMAQGSTIAAPNQVVRTAEGQALTKDNGKAKKAATPVFSNKELKKLTERVTFPMNFMVTDGGTDGVYVTEQRYNNDLKGEHIALGEGSVAFDQQKGYSGLFAAGINAVAGGKDAIAIGNQASATGNNFSIAIGSNAEAPMSNSIALGEGSIANLKLSQQGKQSYLTKEDWNGDYNGVLSLGRDLSGARAEVTRRIIHVAGGAADTDAVNVKQLKALAAKIPKAVDLSKYTTTDKLGAVIEQKLGDTYAKKADIPAAKTFKAVGDGISVTEKDNVITYTLDTSKLPQSSTGVYVTEQRYNNDLKGEHIALGEGSVAFDQQKGYSGLFAAGINAVAGGKDAIAIGNQASATGNNFSIAIGSNAEAPMSNSIALGEGSIANLKLSQQGKQSYLTKEDWNGDYNGVLSLGRDLSGARAEVTRRIIHVAGGAADTDAVNVKQLKALEATLHFSYISIKGTKKDKGTNYNNDGATGNEAIAIGQESQATGNSGIAIGVHSKVMGLENNNLIKGDYGTAIGAWASVKNNDATALGAHTHAWGERSLAIGDRSVGNGIESVAIGSQALADSFNAIAIGGNSSANLENAIAIGKKSKT